jgi:DNA invertase Pin-like site-specific DNA recombinase
MDTLTGQFDRLNNSKWNNLTGKPIVVICRISKGNVTKGMSILEQKQSILEFMFKHNIKSHNKKSELLSNIEFFKYQCSARFMNEQLPMIDALKTYKNTVFMFSCVDRFTRDLNYRKIMDEAKINNNILVFVKEELRSDYEEDEERIHMAIFKSYKEGERITQRNRAIAKFRKENPDKCKKIEKKPACGFIYKTTVIGGISKKLLIPNDNEMKLSSLFKILKNGGSAIKANKILRELTDNNKHALYDIHSQELLTEIPKRMMTLQQIVDFIATFNEEDTPIKYRGKPLTKYTVSKLLKI